jgi:polyisoprenoid-binding protein YceI
MQIQLGSIATLMLTLAIAAPGASAATYEITKKSQFAVRTYIGGAASGVGHDHIIVAVNPTGKVVFDPAAMEKTTIMVNIQTADLRVDADADRRRYKLEGQISKGDIADIGKAMRAEDQLYTKKHKTMKFESTKFTHKSGDKYLVEGNITIRGKSRKVNFPVTMTLKGQNMRARGKLKIMQSWFGYEPYSALFGALKNKDEVDLHLDLVAVTKESPAAAEKDPAAAPAGVE